MKNTILKKKMPLAAATWTDAFRRVRNRIALVAAAICAATGNALAEDIISYNTPGGTVNYGSETHIEKTGSNQRILVQTGTVNINEGGRMSRRGET